MHGGEVLHFYRLDAASPLEADFVRLLVHQLLRSCDDVCGGIATLMEDILGGVNALRVSAKNAVTCMYLWEGSMIA